ncbi:unnamed protein product [Microthlaspi erraticum]|uniref:Uncharacterized protein n=1 Tax=Microthlaspi erraticum TaxID=1685480 RepID=A0A6D2J7G9_9BRAS|nr:unnamed protein product [Microthlaspi erraticum]
MCKKLDYPFGQTSPRNFRFAEILVKHLVDSNAIGPLPLSVDPEWPAHFWLVPTFEPYLLSDFMHSVLFVIYADMCKNVGEKGSTQLPNHIQDECSSTTLRMGSDGGVWSLNRSN